MSLAQDLRAVFDWLAEWPAEVGERNARDTGLWPWNLYEKRLSDVLVPAWVDAYEKGYREASGQVAKRLDPSSLRYANPRTVALAYQHTARLITEVVRDTRTAVSHIMGTAFAEGQDWRQIAARVRNVVGIHSRNAAAVDRRYMDRLIDYQERGMNPAQAREKAGRLAERERARAVRSRSVTIARTETTKANTLSRRDAWKDADAQGLIPPGSQSEWLAYDPCELCAGMSGKRVPWRDSFSPTDPPLHPRCRCTILLITPKGTPQRPIDTLTPEKAQQIADTQFPVSERNFLGTHPTAGQPYESAVYRTAGYDAPTQLLDEAAFDAHPGTAWHRGVKYRPAVDAWKQGDYYVGQGQHLNGTYLSDNLDTAARYAGDEGAVWSLKLKPGAKVFDYRKQVDELPGDDDMEPIWLARQGYDAAIVERKGESFLIVLNRGATVTKR